MAALLIMRLTFAVIAETRRMDEKERMRGN